MTKILSSLHNLFIKNNINNLIADLKRNNFTNRTVLKYLEKYQEKFLLKKIRRYLL